MLKILKYILFVIIIFVIISIVTLAITPKPLFWIIQNISSAKEFPKPDNYKEVISKIDQKEDIVYNNDYESSKFDLYTPKTSPKEKLPVIVFFHGGGFFIGDKSMSTYFTQSLASEGYAVLNVNYELSPNATIKEQVKQVSSISNFIANNADKYNFDINNINLSGSSAGGFLAYALTLANTNKDFAKDYDLKINSDIKIKSTLLYSAVYDMEVFQDLKLKFPLSYLFAKIGWGLTGEKNWQSDQKLGYELNLNNYITSDLPPIFITDGNKMTFTKQAQETVEKLKVARNDVSTLFFDDTQKVGHGYQLKMDTEPAKEAFIKSILFLKEHN